MPEDVILPPLGTISDEDQSGLILVLTALSLTFILVAFTIRIFVRVPYGLWKLDDNVLLVASILACIQTSIVFVEVHHGLGTAEGFELVRKWYFANNLIYILALTASKLTVSFLYLRLTAFQSYRKAIIATLIGSAAWAVMSILLLTIDCSWQSQCINSFGRWLVIGIFDCVIEAALGGMSIFLVKGTQISPADKIYIVLAFGMRILTIPACAVRLYYLNPSTIPDNRNFALSLAIVCAQIQQGYGIMAASMAILRRFTSVYHKVDRTEHPNQTYIRTYHGQKGPAGPKVRQQSVIAQRNMPLFSNGSNSRQKSHNSSANRTLSSDYDPPSFRPGNPHSYSVEVTSASRPNTSASDLWRRKDPQPVQNSSMNSYESRKLIIEVNTDYSVHSDHSDGDSIRPDTVTDGTSVTEMNKIMDL